MTTTSGLKKSSSSPEQSTGAESAMGFERVSKFCVHYRLTVMSNTFKSIEIEQIQKGIVWLLKKKKRTFHPIIIPWIECHYLEPSHRPAPTDNCTSGPLIV